MLKQKENKAFTLIEILVVILIIIIFVVIAYPNLSSWTEKRETKKEVLAMVNKIEEVKSDVSSGKYGMAMIHWHGNRDYLKAYIHSMSNTDYINQYKKIKSNGKSVGGRDANARKNCHYDIRRQPWKREETFTLKNIRHHPNTWMCISRDGSIRGGTEENDPGTGERLGMLVLCSVNTSSQSQPDQCRYSNKEKGYYKINWTDSTTIIKAYSYNEKKSKWILLK